MKNEIIHGDCLAEMAKLNDGTIDAIVTDPPYKYLKNQKLETDFDEDEYVRQAKRVLKKDGMIAIFGRGSSFYRICTKLSEAGFQFKEEVIWDKTRCTSPVLPISRVHETCAIFGLGNAKINKVKVPYTEMKDFDFQSILADINRIKSALNNTKSFDALLAYLENNALQLQDKDIGAVQRAGFAGDGMQTIDRSIFTVHSIDKGMTEKSIIRTDFVLRKRVSNHEATVQNGIGSNDQSVTALNQIAVGMNEKSIIKESRDHFKTEHPTQKPVRLLERIIALVSKQDDVILDTFSGSGSTLVAAVNTKRIAIGIEIDKEYFDISTKNLNNAIALKTNNLFYPNQTKS